MLEMSIGTRSEEAFSVKQDISISSFRTWEAHRMGEWVNHIRTEFLRTLCYHREKRGNTRKRPVMRLFCLRFRDAKGVK